jgi:Divergent polysaccharide deacetylase
VTIPGNPDATKPLFDPKLVEATRHGAVPKIGPDGVRPSSRYAQPRQLPPNKKDSFLIAVIVGGVGISTSGTADALAKLPASITFALTPYGADLEKLAERARSQQHEMLLQVPMEPFNYPDNDPGPANAADLVDLGAESRPATLADEPFPRLRRSHELYGRAIYCIGAGTDSGLARRRAAGSCLC